MRLKDLIDALAGMPQDAIVVFDTGLSPSGFESWRGRYNELTLIPDGRNTVRVAELLADARNAVGRTFQGNKGGDFTMAEYTPVWADQSGECGHHGITDAVFQHGTVVLRTMVIPEEYH